MEYLAGMLLHSGLMFAERITLAHFSVSSTMNLPKTQTRNGCFLSASVGQGH
jgi:hypothetical protein